MRSVSDESILSHEDVKLAMRPFAKLLWTFVVVIDVVVITFTIRSIGPSGCNFICNNQKS